MTPRDHSPPTDQPGCFAAPVIGYALLATRRAVVRRFVVPLPSRSGCASRRASAVSVRNPGPAEALDPGIAVACVGSGLNWTCSVSTLSRASPALEPENHRNRTAVSLAVTIDASRQRSRGQFRIQHAIDLEAVNNGAALRANSEALPWASKLNGFVPTRGCT